jgi:hypothetical protein
MATTHHGMRVALKKRPSGEEYILKAVKAGIYRLKDESLSQHRARSKSNTIVLPEEYYQLKLNALEHPPPKMPLKYLRRIAREEQSKVTKLAKSYLRKTMHGEMTSTTTTMTSQKENDERTIQDYYRKILGVPAPPLTSAMGKQSSILNKAYAVAIKQEELMRSNKDMTEKESLRIVEDLLQEDQKKERHRSRILHNKISEWNKVSQAQKKSSSNDSPKANPSNIFNLSLISDSQDSKTNTEEDFTTSVPSVLHSKPRTIRGISIWSKKLQAVPYKEWTVGASVALDHFVAVSVLGISNHTWNTLLEGTSQDPSLRSLGRDIVLTRRILFPETGDEEAKVDMTKESSTQVEQDEETLKMKNSIEELLASLNELNSNDDDDSDDDDKFDWKDDNDEPDESLDDLLSDLQTWRAKQMDLPYDQWTEAEKESFDSWLVTYVNILEGSDDNNNNNKNKQIDWDATREAVLSLPPLTRDESTNFWESIRDETQVELFLENLDEEFQRRKLQHEQEQNQEPSNQGPLSLISPAIYSWLEPFWELPHAERVRRLSAMGVLRPLLDEYADPKDRLAFLEQHRDTLLEGLELEHIVKDPNGDILGSDLKEQLSKSTSMMTYLNEDDIDENDRYSIQIIPYAGNQVGRALLMEWNRYKAGRAMYEEYLFKSGKLGLRYSDKSPRGDSIKSKHKER